MSSKTPSSKLSQPVRVTVYVGRWPKIPARKFPGIPTGTFSPTTAPLISGPTEAILAADKLVERLRNLATDLAVPTPRSYGINEQEWKKLTPLMAEQAIHSGSTGNNPVVPEVTEVAALFDQVFT